MHRVLITGASGFLGNHLVKSAPEDVKIMAQYNRTSVPVELSYTEQVKMDFYRPDWTKIIDFRPGVIIHTAAMSKVNVCESAPEKARHFNFVTTRKLLQLASELEARFIFTSSDQIYDGSKGNYSEKDEPGPLNVYARTKLDAEDYILQNYSNAVSMRCALMYGQSLNNQLNFTEIMLRHLNIGKPVKVFVDQFRSPIQVNDLARAIWELAEIDFHGALNLGGSQSLSRYDMARLVCERFDLPKKLLIPIKSREQFLSAPRPADCSLNTELAQNILQTELKGFSEGIGVAFKPEMV